MIDFFFRGVLVKGNSGETFLLIKEQKFSSRKGKKANENVGDMPKIGGV